jgi:hypothetical protein
LVGGDSSGAKEEEIDQIELEERGGLWFTVSSIQNEVELHRRKAVVG